MIEVGGESNGEQPGNDHESLQSTTPAVASLLQATQASGDLLAHSRAPQVRSMVSSAEASAHEVATTVAVVTSSDVSLTGSPTSSSYQHYLAPATVSIGGHIQNITIPAQVSVTSPGVAVAAASPSQNLARILAAASQQGYSSPSAPGTSRVSTTASGLLSSSGRLAATSPAALLATTQPPAQQQAIVMDTLTQDEQQRLLSYSSLMASPSPPRTPQRSPTATTNVLAPQFVVPPKQSTTNVLPVPPPPPPPASSPTASTSSVAVSGPTRPGGLLQLVGVESPRAAKRIKLEEQPPANEEVAAMRQQVYEHRWRELQRNKENYVEHLTELFFLQNGGNMMDYFAWKRRPTPQLLALLRAHALDSEDEEDPARLLDTRPPSALLAATASSAAAATTAAAAAAAAVVTTTVIAGMLSSSSLMAVPAATSTTTVSTADAAMATATALSAIASQLAASPGQPLVPAMPPSSVPSPGPKGLADPCSSASSSSQQTPASAVLRPPSPLRVPAVATPTTGGSSPSKGGALRQPPSAAAGAAAPATPVTPASAAAAASGSSASPLTLPASRLATRQHSISAVYDSSIGSQEEIVERAKQEAYVMQRIAELRKDGMWSARRLPKVQEPPRAKAHWDYLLEEMVWLATDFAQERKWKKAAAKKCARMVLRYHQEREQRAERAEREELQRLRRVAAQVAKEIKQFWTNIEKLVEFKQQTRLEEKRKKALDLHLNFIMDQTEKYSSWLREGMGATNKDSTEASEATTPAQAPASPARSGSSNDEDFQPDASDSDDEETIDREETTAPTDQEEQSRELELLQKESELPIEQLLDSLPPEILERPASPLPHTNGGGNHKADDEDDDGGSSERSGSPIDVESVKADEEVDGADDGADGGDDDFQVEDEEDDEETLEEQEEQEKTVDHKEELKELMMEGEMPLDALYEKYGGAYASDAEVPNAAGSSGEEEEEDDTADNERDSDNSDEEMDEEEEEEDMDTSSEGEVQEDIGMEYLINPMSDEVDSEVKAENATEDASGKGPTKEITDIAATAQSFQPKGNTLSTTQVQTKVPWLLKHSLREYQHIGLDWLVTMHDKKLNGILADEMGLGKTIQTISLLAHMACDKGIWGPHLIVVPTSVMLNWEMEFKKWCPAFKILTYYGIPKERKQKRQGWTKPNAFHVCITSYKLVVQDHQAFRRKKWKYLILDEAQHIKNFKSQRWQMLLNFQSSRRLLLTGTPLQNSLMELWSLMHFLMPSVFQSHREFREWFANPVTGMIEGSSDYNESLIKRLHKVLRPFLLRRLKCEVEKQLPKKYEHVVMCRLSNRQRYLYDDFMSQTKTKETLATGNFMSVINVLMQLRKVCNHPNMFEPRPIVSPFRMEGLVYYTASRVYDICKYDPFKHVSFSALNLLLADVELCLTAFAAHRIKKFQTSCHFVETIESHPPPPPRCPPGKIRLHIRTSAPSAQSGAARAASPMVAAGHHGAHHQRLVAASGAHHHATGMVVRPGHQGVPGGGATFTMARHGAVLTQGHHPGGLQQQPQQQQQRLVVVSTPGTVTPRAHSPVVAAAPSSAGGGGSGEYMLQLVQKSNALAAAGGQPVMGSPITLQIQPPAHGTGPARVAVPFGIGRIVQTTTGQHLLLTPAQQTPQTMSDGTTAVQQQHQTVMLATSAGQTVVRTTTALSQMGRVVTSAAGSPAATQVSTIAGAKPVVRVAPLNVNSQATHAGVTKTVNAKTTVVAPVKSSGATTTESSSQRSPYYLDTLESRRRQQRREKLRLLGHTNALRCAACPTYGRDLVEAVTVVHDTRPVVRSPWGGTGYVACLNAPSQGETQLWRYTRTLRSVVRTPPQLLDELRDMIDRFVFSVPKVTASRIEMRVSHPSPSSINAERVLEERLRDELGPRCAFLHPVMCNLQTQFPELRLIQYDCGKLQVLDKLLWQLRGGQHRVLIFTQMTRMLDVLEQFLNYHGHTYLRLDGSTRVDQRQALMERFNADRRIFCFILSTRSGGIGVNLTGADTVVFYDSDWNPTMDAQAQDRCHRIGQTRDVHIYRLISERTVEENILKKANQKRMLGDLAIEGGNFTTAFFKQNTLKDLFGTDFGLAFAEKSEESQREDRPTEPERPEKFSSVEFEKALGMAEEELDVQAAHTARAEAAAELAEFDESIPLDTDSRDEDKSQAEEELDKLMDQLTPVERYAMQFLESLQEPLTLEQLKQAEEEIEAQKKDWELGRLKAIKEEEERRAGYRDDEEAPALVYSREDAYTQIYISMNGHEQMPIWAPPTPPQDENDLYIDYSVGFLYEPSVMSESSLPAVYIKKEAKRLKVDPLSTVAAARKQKSRKEDAVHIPKSLFDRPTAAILKMRREAKLQKVKNLMVCGAGQLPPKALTSLPSRPLAQQGGFLAARPLLDLSPDMPEWLIHEDWAILQVIQQLQDIPLNLTVLSPGHTPNWDLVADVVNTVSRIYRSPKQCKDRYESVIVPREEGKILYDTNPKKQKKTKGIYKTKNNKPMRTGQLFSQDCNQAFTMLYHTRFDTIRAVASKRTPTLKPTFTANPLVKNPKHAAVLADNGISYDQPPSPTKLAQVRAERIAKEKQKSQMAAAAAAEAQRQQQAQQQQHQQGQLQAVGQAAPAGTQTSQPAAVAAAQAVTGQAAAAVVAAASPATAGVVAAASPATAAALLVQQQQQQQQQVAATQAVLATLGQAQQLQPVAAQLSKNVTTVALAKSGGILVSTAVTATTAAAGGVVSAAPTFALTKVPVTAVATLSTAALRPQRPQPPVVTATTTMTVQEMVAVATGQVRGLPVSSAITTAGGSTPAVVSVTNLTSAQLQPAPQRISAVAAVSQVTAAQGVASVQGGRSLTASQLQAMRQGNFLRQHQQQQRMQQLKQQQLKRLQQQQQLAAAGTTQATVAVPVSLAGTAKVAVSAAVQQARPLTQQQQVQQQQQVSSAQQQQAQQQQQAVAAAVAAVKAATPLGTAKQQTAITRSFTEAEMAQLIKRRELQQKQQQMAAAHLLAQAQLQQQQQAQQQAGQQTQQVVAVSQQQQSLACTVQTPVATLVKTVSAPSALGTSQTAVTIPVSAVTMAGVNINVSLAQQGKVTATSKPITTASVTPQQMQLRQLQIQQQLLQQQQQRKVTLQTQQKVAGLSQAQLPTGKAPTVATQLGTVQIVQQGSGQGAKATTLPSATAITVQQIIKQVLPVNQNFLVSSAVQSAAGGSSGGATTVSPATQVQLHAMLHKPAVSTVALAAPTAASSGATTATLVPTRIMALQQPPGQPTAVALKQGLQPSQSDQQPTKRGGAPPSQSTPDSGRL